MTDDLVTTKPPKRSHEDKMTVPFEVRIDTEVNPSDPKYKNPKTDKKLRGNEADVILFVAFGLGCLVGIVTGHPEISAGLLIILFVFGVVRSSLTKAIKVFR